MSAFALSRTHLSLTAAILEDEVDPHYRVAPDTGYTLRYPELFILVRDANAGSLEYRYQTDDGLRALCAIPKPQATGKLLTLSPGAKLKILHCFEYQSCERDDWPQSLVYTLIRRAEASLMRRAPGYEATPWGIDDDAPGTKVVEVVSLSDLIPSRQDLKR